jgi:chorismate mutase
MGKKLAALRGAVSCRNESGDIAVQTAALYDALLRENRLEEGDIVSLVFSLTADLDQKNPAAALRESGRGKDLALFVTAEAPVKGGLPRIIRVLLHCYLEEGVLPCHVYRNGAEALRPDRVKKTGGGIDGAGLALV